MHRMLRRLCSRQGERRAAIDGSVVLTHASGAVLCGADGAALVFESAARAEEFSRRYLCEPAAYRRQAAAVWSGPVSSGTASSVPRSPVAA